MGRRIERLWTLNSSLTTNQKAYITPSSSDVRFFYQPCKAAISSPKTVWVLQGHQATIDKQVLIAPSNYDANFGLTRSEKHVELSLDRCNYHETVRNFCLHFGSRENKIWLAVIMF